MSDFDTYGLSIEPIVTPPPLRLLDADMWRIEGTVNESTPALEDACATNTPINMLFTEDGERRYILAYVRNFTSDGKIMKATIVEAEDWRSEMIHMGA